MEQAVIIALDFKSRLEVEAFLKPFGDEKLFLKVGMELFYKEGPAIVESLKQKGHFVFLDLKLHDIPQTVHNAMRQLASLGADMVTVHVAGGSQMLTAAMAGLKEGTAPGKTPPLCVGVTVLTSSTDATLKDELGCGLSLPAAVRQYAQLARKSGLDGVVCSAHETATVREVCGGDFITVTPGIRLAGEPQDDQERVATPRRAREQGSSFIVVGRSITRATDPFAQYQQIKNEFVGRDPAQQIAGQLLDIGAISLRPNDFFTWASGIKSPIYCDNRLTLSHPHVRKTICQGLVGLIRSRYPEVEVIAGTATAGIPHAAWVSDAMDLPMVYVRAKPKDHGKGNQIEGRIQPGQKVVVVEDLISTGGSVLDCVNALQEADCEVLGVAAIFSYELPVALQRFNDAGIPMCSLSSYGALMEVARHKGVIEESDLATLRTWRIEAGLGC